MASVLKTSLTHDDSGIQTGLTASAASVNTPLDDNLTHIRKGLVAVRSTTTTVGYLDDVITAGTGITKTISNPSGDGTMSLAVNWAAPGAAIGTTTPVAITASSLAISGAATPITLTLSGVVSSLTVDMTEYEDTLTLVPGIRFSRSAGTSGTPTAVQSATQMGRMVIRSYDGSAFNNVANMVVLSSEIHSPTAHGSYFLWQITPDTTATMTSKMTLNTAGLDVADLLRAGGVRVDADPGSGVASTLTLTHTTDTPTTDPGWTTSSTVNMNAPDGYLKAYIGTQAITVPYWNT